MVCANPPCQDVRSEKTDNTKDQRQTVDTFLDEVRMCSLQFRWSMASTRLVKYLKQCYQDSVGAERYQATPYFLVPFALRNG